MLKFRKRGIRALRPFVKQDINLVTLEKYTYLVSRTEQEYFKLIYWVIGNLLENSKRGISKQDSIQEIINLLNTHAYQNWQHPMFQKYRLREQEQIDFLEAPIQVEEGVLQCGKCGSKRTLSYAKQVRAGDEATSVFAQCVQCNHRWREN